MSSRGPSSGTIRVVASAGFAAVASAWMLTVIPRLQSAESGAETWEVRAFYLLHRSLSFPSLGIHPLSL